MNKSEDRLSLNHQRLRNIPLTIKAWKQQHDELVEIDRLIKNHFKQLKSKNYESYPQRKRGY